MVTRPGKTTIAPPGKTYDQAYFDRWYRHRGTRIATRDDVARKARLVLGVGEAVLQRPVRSVLDIGCGEGDWRAPLRRWRPGLRYVGIDSSEYVVARFGKRRGIRWGAFGDLPALARSLRGPFDLIVCCDVLQYVPTDELRAGLRTLARLLGGVAYLEAYTTGDAVEGDRHAWHHRSAATYRRTFREARLTSVGMHCWVGPAMRPTLAQLEMSGSGR